MLSVPVYHDIYVLTLAKVNQEKTCKNEIARSFFVANICQNMRQIFQKKDINIYLLKVFLHQFVLIIFSQFVVNKNFLIFY